ncbi:MAG: bifunctional 5,10-methylenetetrahydrofolate dehydrogenase/5,10-methenyltetrahydrofolate cyclohydrolase [Anaerovoracaceae bacterium]
MFTLLKGKPVKDEIINYVTDTVESLKASGTDPMLAVLRAGEDSGQIYYEQSILKNAAKYGISTRAIDLPESVTQEELERALKELNDDDNVHGIIMLRPFPKHIDSDKLTSMLDPGKDIDAITDMSIAGLFSGRGNSFYACTAEACMELARYYCPDLKGRKVTVLGRSLTVGKPLAIMMLNEHATVTICHSRTPKEDQIAACRNADIVVLATGQTESYGSEYFRNGHIVLDVGTGTGRKGTIAGDLDIEDIEAKGEITELAYSPVPGGVGVVTTTLLMRNVVNSAKRKANK